MFKSGHTLVLGGLIRESNRQGALRNFHVSVRYPILGLFVWSQRRTQYNKTELLLMVTLMLVNNQEEADAVTREFQYKVKTIKERLEKNKPARGIRRRKSEASNINNTVTVAVGWTRL